MPTQSETTVNAFGDQANAVSVAGRSDGQGFFPLTIGNQWTYLMDQSFWVEGDSTREIGLYRQRRQLTGSETLFDRVYVLEVQKSWSRLSPEPPSDSETYWIRYRQDRAGLYEADVSVTTPPRAREVLAGRSTVEDSQGMDLMNPARRLRYGTNPSRAAAYDSAVERLSRKRQLALAAVSHFSGPVLQRHGHTPGGVLPGEITRLKYPLHPGQSWMIREDPRFTSTVVRHEVLDLPAGRFGGWRIRIDIEGADFGADDAVLIWYGRAGFLGMSVHVESEYTDYENPYGTGEIIYFEEHSRLERLDLIKHTP